MQSATAVTLTTERVNASIVPNRGTNGGFSLVIDGTTQSHVNPEDPRDLQLDYVRAIAALIDAAFPIIGPIKALHLGGGALTVPRYVAATRIGSRQRVVELHGELLAFVMENLPVSPDVDLELIVGDARDAVEAHRATDTGAWDIVTVDVFSGAIAPRHVSTSEFYAMVADALAPNGVVIVNTLTSHGLPFAHDAVATLSALFPHVVAVAPQAVSDGERIGNIVLAAARRPIDVQGLTVRAADWPRPARVFTEGDVTAFARHGVVRHDAPEQAAG
jgi:Spermidine synthase